MMKKSILLATALLATHALTANTVFFSSDKVMALSKAGKALQGKQFKIQNELQQLATTEQRTLEDRARDLQSKVQAQSISAEEFAGEQSLLSVKQREAELKLEQQKLAKGSDLMQDENALKTELSKLVQKKAAKDGCSILDTKALNGLFVVNAKDDVTQELVAELDKIEDKKTALAALDAKPAKASPKKTA